MMMASMAAASGTSHSDTISAAPAAREHFATSALSRLHESPYRGLRGVALNLHGNTMILTGQVRTFFLKQMAQHLVGDFAGTVEIRNELRVA